MTARLIVFWLTAGWHWHTSFFSGTIGGDHFFGVGTDANALVPQNQQCQQACKDGKKERTPPKRQSTLDSACAGPDSARSGPRGLC